MRVLPLAVIGPTLPPLQIQYLLFALAGAKLLKERCEISLSSGFTINARWLPERQCISSVVFSFT